MKGTRVWDNEYPKEKKCLFMKIKTVPIFDERKTDWSWVWDGLVEYPNGCWLWEGSTDQPQMRLLIRCLVGKTDKEISCRTSGCLNPKHKVMA